MTLLTRLTRKNPITREVSLRDLVDNMKEIFNIDYEYDMVKERGILNFKTQIIGREKEIKKVLMIDRNLQRVKNIKRQY